MEKHSLPLVARQAEPVENHAAVKTAVREYWNSHVHDWKVAKHPAGTLEFFREIEDYRFEKLEYLDRIIPFDGYRGKQVLDVGCGVGNDLTRFAKGGAQVVGIDLAEHSIELARKNFDFRRLNATFVVMDGEEMQFPDDSFDFVYCHTVLHFTPNPERMIREIHRVLRPNGQAIIMTVNKKSWMFHLHRMFRVKIDHLDSPVFCKYTIADFRSMLDVFSEVRIVPERFPVPTKVHEGLQAKLYNKLFIGTFNLLPGSWIRGSGHHLLGFVRKSDHQRRRADS